MPSTLTTASAAIGVPALLLLLTHMKSLPLAYTFRSWWLLRTVIKRAKANKLKPEPLFTVVSEDHRCLYDDIDYNQHMNNIMYNKNLDFGRIHILYTVLPRVMMEPHHHLFCHNAGVMCVFKKEIPPLSNYTIQTRIWTWNQKWMWLQHRFVLPNGDVACYAVSKLVFKKTNGKTVPPTDVFELCGHALDDQVEERRKRNWEVAGNLLEMDALVKDPFSWTEQRVLPPAKL
ncbi:HotDog domain-containing protein [Phascolomyces articulosus]|uniref:HotDog domain-containing protein n=1 Tax=Phascolomyces articulosus TaxID=60185 RepID=A0AAD5KI10_9FUNG|nr:HotDog domain-containing protein [Phascolomyces articulosus]